MANVNNINLAKFTATSGGTGSFVVSAAVTGYQTPLTAGASNFSYRYRAESADLTQWEIGTGAYTSSNVTLTRTPIINSVGGTSAINFTLAPQVGMGIILADDLQGSGQILGTATNDNAASGNVGEYVSANVASSVAVTLTTATAANVASISLSAGDWDVRGNVAFQSPGGTTTLTNAIGYCSSVSATLPSPPNGGSFARYQGVTFGSSSGSPQLAIEFPVGILRMSCSAATTVYLGVFATFATSGLQAFGLIDARRVR